MSTDAPDLRDLMSRVERLERQNRWLKRAGFSMVLGTADLVTPTTGETHRTSAASITMFGNGKDHKVIWKAAEP
jgi:hypothetical protein